MAEAPNKSGVTWLPEVDCEDGWNCAKSDDDPPHVVQVVDVCERHKYFTFMIRIHLVLCCNLKRISGLRTRASFTQRAIIKPVCLWCHLLREAYVGVSAIDDGEPTQQPDAGLIFNIPGLHKLIKQ